MEGWKDKGWTSYRKDAQEDIHRRDKEGHLLLHYTFTADRWMEAVLELHCGFQGVGGYFSVHIHEWHDMNVLYMQKNNFQLPCYYHSMIIMNPQSQMQKIFTRKTACDALSAHPRMHSHSRNRQHCVY